MSEQEFTFGSYPFPPDKKKPVHIRGNLIKNFIYPAEVAHFSDLNQLFVSTDKLTVGTWQLGPGGTYNPPDLHAGDEVYYIVEGTLTEHNPVLGEFINVNKGEALLLPMGGYHKGYNFGQGIMKVLYIIAPKIWLDQEPPMDFAGENMKMYKGKYNSKLKSYPQIQQWDSHGTTDDIGRWPVPGPECRKDPVLFYHITEEKKLLNVHGVEYPMMIKYFVSNDLCHMGEFILPAGGIGCRASEPDSHKGDCCLNIEIGPITIFLTDTLQAYDVGQDEAFFIPEGTRYQLINYTGHMVKAIFSIAPGI